MTDPYARRLLLAFWDLWAWMLGIVVAVTLHLELPVSPTAWGAPIGLAVVAGSLQIVLGYATALYRGRAVLGSFDEVLALTLASALIALALGIPVLIYGPALDLPRNTLLLAFPFVLLIMCSVRYVGRVVLEGRLMPREGKESVLILGAGFLGESLVRHLRKAPTSTIRVVGLLDDDPAKRHLRLYGVPVLGTSRDITRVARKTGATRLGIATGQTDSAMLRELTD